LFFFPSLGFDDREIIQLVLDYCYTGLGRLYATTNHLPALAPGLAEFLLRLVPDLLPMSETLGERVGAVLLATEITEGTPVGLTVVVAVTFDKIIASCVSGSAQNNECHG
jgi:hypothetical protein